MSENSLPANALLFGPLRNYENNHSFTHRPTRFTRFCAEDKVKDAGQAEDRGTKRLSPRFLLQGIFA